MKKLTINGIKQVTGLSRVWKLSDKKMSWALKKFGDHFNDIIVQNTPDKKLVKFVSLVRGDGSVFAVLASEHLTDLEALKLMVDETGVVFPNEL